MKNREERPTASDRGASQQTFDFGDEVNLIAAREFTPPGVDRSGVHRHAVPERLTETRFDGADCLIREISTVHGVRSNGTGEPPVRMA